jgi:hypothetical protein
MHFCKASIAIGSDVRNVMLRDEFNPISWPEVDILRLIHGDDAVTDVIPFVSVNQQGRAERDRLSLIYGEGPAIQCWGGRNSPNELDAPGVPMLPRKFAWKNPITGRVEGELKVPPQPTFRGEAETVGDMSKPPESEPAPEPALVAAEAESDFGSGETPPLIRRKR